MDLDISFFQRISSLPHSESLIDQEPTLPLIKIAFLNSLILTFLTFAFTLVFTTFFLYLGFQSLK